MTQSIKNLPRFTILLFLTYVTCVEIEIDMDIMDAWMILKEKFKATTSKKNVAY